MGDMLIDIEMTGETELYGEYEAHPYARLFPCIEGADFYQLVQDIQDHGQRDPCIIATFDGKTWLLDGRNRYRACLLAGKEPLIVHSGVIATEREALTFILSTNLHRRHLTTSQRAMLGAQIANMTRADTLAQNANPNEINTPTDGQICLSRDREPSISIEQASQIVNASGGSIKHARQVLDKGTEALAKAVQGGDIAVAAASTLAQLPPQEQERLLQEYSPKQIKRMAAQIRKNERQKRFEEKQAKAVQFHRDHPQTYNVILADPPWEYDQKGSNGAAEKHYETLPIAMIHDFLEDHNIEIAKDAVLFLWGTEPLYDQAISTIYAWNFTRKTGWIWDKSGEGSPGLGTYSFTDHEVLHVATKGSFAPLAPKRFSSLFSAPKGEHSEKPAEVYERIETMYPGCNYLEIFARTRRPGWDCIGNELDKFPTQYQTKELEDSE